MPPAPRSRRGLGLVALVVGLVAVPAAIAWAVVIDTSRFIVAADAVQSEDVLVAATSAVVDGRIEGDLVIAAETVVVNGTVTGDVLVTIAGSVEGSVRGVARSVDVLGDVADDVAVAAISVDVGGSVGRDLVGLAARLDIDGSVMRDVLGRYATVQIDGDVGRDAEVTVNRLAIGPGAMVGGDVVYQSSRDADVDDTAVLGGQLIMIPTDAPFFAAVVIQVALIIGFFGYVVGGIAVLWLFRRTGEGAVDLALVSPWRSMGWGLVGVVGAPVVLAALVATLVGIPLAFALLLLVVLGLLFGTVPVAAAVGRWMLQGRGGVYAGFVLVAALWRILVWLLPTVAAVVFIVGLVWGTGSWLMASFRSRRPESAAPAA
jgi:cytoskeletal protein CcmA (bactofilin family)